MDTKTAGQHPFDQAHPLRPLDLDEFDVTNFGLDQANEAVTYAAAHGHPFQSTVIRS